MDASERDHLRKLLGIHNGHIRILKEQLAFFGGHAPSYMVLQYEEQQQEAAKIRNRLAMEITQGGTEEAENSAQPPSGDFQRQVVEALLDAFPTHEKLQIMLRHRLDKNLDAIALGRDLTVITSTLVSRAAAEGWVSDLLSAALQANPRNPRLVALRHHV